MELSASAYDYLKQEYKLDTILNIKYPTVLEAFFGEIEFDDTAYMGFGSRFIIKPLSSSILTHKIYLIIKTKNLENRKLKVNIRQAQKKVIEEVNSNLKITIGNSAMTDIIMNVGEFAKEKNSKNIVDYDYAILEISLKPDSNDQLKKWRKEIEMTDDVSAPIYISVDAESMNTDYPKYRFKYFGSGQDGKYFMYEEDKNFHILLPQFPIKELPHNIYGGKFSNYSFYKKPEENAAVYRFKRTETRLHAARDLYSDENTEVYAIDSGEVINKAYFYEGTWQVTVLHDYEYLHGHKLIIRYGELDEESIKHLNPPEINQKTKEIVPGTGTKLKQGDFIGKYGCLIHQDAYNKIYTQLSKLELKKKENLSIKETIDLNKYLEIKKKYKSPVAPRVNEYTKEVKGVYMLHFEAFTGSEGENVTKKNLKLSQEGIGEFSRRADIFDSYDILRGGFKKLLLMKELEQIEQFKEQSEQLKTLNLIAEDSADEGMIKNACNSISSKTGFIGFNHLITEVNSQIENQV